MSLWLAPRHNIRFPGCLLSFILWLFLATCDCARIYCDIKTNNAVDHGRKYVFMYFRTVIAHSPLSFWVVFSFLFSMHVRCACIVQQSDDGRSRGRGWQECCWFFFSSASRIKRSIVQVLRLCMSSAWVVFVYIFFPPLLRSEGCCRRSYVTKETNRAAKCKRTYIAFVLARLLYREERRGHNKGAHATYAALLFAALCVCG